MIFSSQVSNLGRPKISHGGSSMWIAILMSHSRHVGIIASKKYFKLAHKASLSTGLYAANNSSNFAIRSGSQPGNVNP